MAVARSLRRTNPITLILAGLLTIGFLFFIFSPSSAASPAVTSNERKNYAAENALSPPTKPFLKEPPVKANGHRAPPPVVRYAMNNNTATANPIENQERILILTPLARFYVGYWENLVKLSYPHQYISLGFIIPKTREGNAAASALQSAIAATQSGPVDDRFASITILRQDFDPPISSQDEKERHKMQNQRIRREAMSRARNSLLFTTLGPSTSWVLWLDGDIVETPPTLIQDLARHDKPVLVPNCYQRYRNPETRQMDIRPYDYNSWVDTEKSLQIASAMGPEEIMLEGYAELPTYRTLMAHLADKSPNRDVDKIMPLDGVGGTALMVKADVHRDGAMFPPFPFYHMVETEGFAKMARRLGWKCFGLPNYFVYHYNE
ncbi:Golgi mannosyltransferase complex subunit [Onygenales sp. PD_40]|nr:Golgi mannosyltransferase complex subunit [Onygenales sp. PD_40]KAK2782686.1 Golgi mannosyltransferase complex subunit [Onygenales sp. PD_12]KAK2785443.1 Golgi mannosyltransferase complex subunit [Emmonsiellopsis sp. PD_33]KAK2802189.1 Golgi mannosyltransferase complex subunit [Onygenales sp. PD_10]